jgi:DegV family protein with EDD domain
MPQTCILTDPTALFIEKSFPGSEFTFVLDVRKYELVHPRENGAYYGDLASALTIDAQQFRHAYLSLAQKYNEIFVVLTSSQLNKRQFESAQNAAESLKGRVSIQVVDSQTFGPGVGEVVSAAAASARDGQTLSDIYRQTQNHIAHVYTMFCSRELIRLANQGEFDHEHAVIAELLGVSPLLILENDRIFSTQKARNSRHLVELFMEFIDEFYALKRIFLVQGNPLFGSEFNQISERLTNGFPEVNLTLIEEYPVIQALLGQRSLGIIAIDR